MRLARSARSAVGACVVAASLVALPTAGAATTPAQLAPQLVWSYQLGDPNGPIALSSPAPAVLDGRPAVVVGDRSGQVLGLDLQGSGDGSTFEEPGWPVRTGAPVDATASTPPDGSRVFVDAGDDASAPGGQGGFQAWSPSGASLWQVGQEQQPGSGGTSAVSASPTVARLQGRTAVVAGTLGQELDEITADGQVAQGFPWYEGDTNGSTAAVGDLYGTGTNEIVEGGDQTAGLSYNTTYRNGGVIRVLSQAGNTGQPELNGGEICAYQSDQVVRSSPAIGRFLGGGAMGIVDGTGSYGGYAGAADTGAVIALDTSCHRVWRDVLDGLTTDSPAIIADPTGANAGGLDVVEGTNVGGADTAGSVYLLNGTNGAVIWRVSGLPPVLGSITTADLGTGYQDLVVPFGTDGVWILDGRTGATVAQLEQAIPLGVQDSPLVTADPNGTIGITVAGFRQEKGTIVGSEVDHYELPGTDARLVHEPGAWPQFHHDAQLTGDAGDPPVTPTTRCRPPVTGPQGYWEVGGDGGVFTYGDLPFCGSTGALRLVRPVVGVAGSADGAGYWLVAADGGIFAFGDAAFFGSTGALALNKPIVAMAVTPDQRGYWLVASDGGVFAFGDAGYFGSTGALTLNKPIVAVASTPDGQGYWLVASDGGVFAFGDAGFLGSTGGTKLAKPIVAIVSDTQTQGYWLVGSDGGVFAYDAPFLGSTGGIKLTGPVVAAQAVGYGAGYRFEAADGGVFSFGAATFAGSAGNLQLSAPVVGAAGY